MNVWFPVDQSSINAVGLRCRTQLPMSNKIRGLQAPRISSSFSSSFSHWILVTNYVGLCICRKPSCSTIMGRTTRGGYFGSCFSKQSGNTQVVSSIVSWKRHNKILLSSQIMCMRLLACKKKMLLKIKSNVGQITSPQDCVSDEKNAKVSRRNEVYKEYSVIGELDIRPNTMF